MTARHLLITWVTALLDAGQPGEKMLAAGVAVGHQQPGERGRDARGDIALAPRGKGLQPGQPPVRGPDDQHVRGTRGRLLLAVAVLFFFLPRRGLRGVLTQHVHRGLVAGQRVLAGQRREHRLLEPGLAQLRRQPGTGLIHPARRDRHARHHGHHSRGPPGRHVPVPGQHHRGVQHRPAGHRALVRARRRLGERDHPAARALQARQQPFGHLPDHFHVDDLRPPRARGRRAVQPSLAAEAFRRRPRFLHLTGIRLPGQAFALVPGLPAPLAVLTPLPLRFLPPPGLAPLPRPDALPRRRRPGIRAVLAQPAFQLRNPQLQPPVPFQRDVQLGPQHRVLSVLRLDHGPQPSQELTLLPGISRQTRRIGTCHADLTLTPVMR